MSLGVIRIPAGKSRPAGMKQKPTKGYGGVIVSKLVPPYSSQGFRDERIHLIVHRGEIVTEP